MNVAPSDRPQDVYSDVAEMVNKLRREDAQKDNQMAQSLDGLINRKVVLIALRWPHLPPATILFTTSRRNPPLAGDTS